MDIQKWLNLSVNKLKVENIPTSQLDAEILLCDLLQKDRSWLAAHQEFVLDRDSLQILELQITRRSQHEPLAYIRGCQEFYGREFLVSPDTLTPRPETETLVELALETIKKNSVRTIADIGSGSGCIIITIDVETTDKIDCCGYEISDKAIKIAEKNAKNLSSSAKFIMDDITTDFEHPWENTELIVANLPYVPTDFHINLAATHEPESAIFGGTDGLDYYRHLFSKLTEKANFVITESLPPQHKELQKIAKDSGFSLVKTQDFIQLFSRY